MTPEIARIARATGATHVVAWVEHHLGEVEALERLPRWRPGWLIDARGTGGALELYARGERGPDFPSPFPLAHEAAVHHLLEAQGIPVPHVHGLVDGDGVRTLVMQRVPGEQGLALAADAEQRRALMRTCVEHMARMHRIDLAEIEARGFSVPSNPRDTAMSEVYQRVAAAYDALEAPRDPLIEHLRSWLERHLPDDATPPAFVAWDSAQFLHHHGRLTALIDFELAHVGHPYMDLAALRTRDSMEPLGDLGAAFDAYAALTGRPIDYDRLRYYEISQLTVTLMLQYPVVVAPDPDSDYVTHLTWYTDSARYALDVLAELAGATPGDEDIADAGEHPSPQLAAHRHLVRSLRRGASLLAPRDLARYGVAVAGPSADPGAAPDATGGADPFAAWRARCDYRLARHLYRVAEIGAAVEEAELDDAAALLGRRPPDLVAADAGLVDLVHASDPASEGDLLRFFSRRMQRRHRLLGPADSLIVRHPALQPLPDRG